VPLSLADLAVNGDDLMREAGIPPGPGMGTILERLLDSVINDPERNVPGRCCRTRETGGRRTTVDAVAAGDRGR
jgi:hypothetical protein